MESVVAVCVSSIAFALRARGYGRVGSVAPHRYEVNSGRSYLGRKVRRERRPEPRVSVSSRDATGSQEWQQLRAVRDT